MSSRIFFGVFSSGRRFDPRGYVHGKGTDLADGLCDVFGFQASRQNQGVSEFPRLHSEVPIEACAGSAGRSRDVRIQEPSIGGLSEVRQLLQRFRSLDSERLNHTHWPEKRQTHFGRFVSVQLDRVEACLGNGGTDVLGVGIDEEPHTTDEGREASCDGRGPPRFNEPRRSGYKDKPQRVGPGFDGGPSIFLSGDAADLDAQGHGVRGVFLGL